MHNRALVLHGSAPHQISEPFAAPRAALSNEGPGIRERPRPKADVRDAATKQGVSADLTTKYGSLLPDERLCRHAVDGAASLLDTCAEGQHVPRVIEIRLGEGVELGHNRIV
jgi:hypothetical protein